jgi:murein DD-endopeptidase MepM/ murein hydrolase activator NlpD
MASRSTVIWVGLLGLGCSADPKGAGPAAEVQDSAAPDEAPGDENEDSGTVEDTGPAPPVAFALPLAEPERFTLVVGVDHDPAVSAGDDPLGRTVCTDYLERGFPHCYDEHDGSDYILQGGFGAMDDGSTQILAGADGTVTLARDGHYDRCRADASGVVDCDGHEMISNSVILEHVGSDGRRYRTKYWHMMKETVAVEEGQEVHQGDVLGKVGSSGNSSMPHLHFELEVEVEGAPDTWEVVDPYAGPASQELSYWCAQGPAEGLPGGC